MTQGRDRNQSWQSSVLKGKEGLAGYCSFSLFQEVSTHSRVKCYLEVLWGQEVAGKPLAFLQLRCRGEAIHLGGNSTRVWAAVAGERPELRVTCMYFGREKGEVYRTDGWETYRP